MQKLNLKTKLSYGVGNLAYGSLTQTLNSFVMFFATAVLGIRGALVGIAVGISTLWDGVSDPIFGYWSDVSSNKKLGKRLNFMFFATFFMAISNMLLWTIPAGLSVGLKFMLFLIALLLIETASTIFATPYFALGVDLAPDYSQQNLIQGHKTVFFILGMLVPSFLMMVFMPNQADSYAQFKQINYIKIGITISILVLICGLASIFGTVKAYKKTVTFERLKQNHNKQGFLKTIKKFAVALKNKNYFSVIIGYSVALLSSSFLISVGMHLFTYAYHFNSTQIPVLMMVLLFSAIISQPFWIYLANREEKKKTLNTSLITLLFGIGLTVITFIFRDNILNKTLFYLTLPCIFVSGFGTGALYTIPLSMFADTLTMDKLKTGENNSATYGGFMTIAHKVANSLALTITGLLLDFIKFDPKQPVQPISVQNSLGKIVFLGCAISISVSMLFFSKYNLKRTQVLKAQMNKDLKSLKNNPNSAFKKAQNTQFTKTFVAHKQAFK